MTIKELKEQLSKFDENLEIGAVASVFRCTCGQRKYCYCSSEDIKFYLSNLEQEKLPKKPATKIFIRMEEE